MDLFKSLETWIKDRSLPTDHLISPALALVEVMDKNGLYPASVYEINLHTLVNCYTALGDLANVQKYANIMAVWHLVRGDTKMGEFMTNPQTPMRNKVWRARV
jgi:hypothetical protein